MEAGDGKEALAIYGSTPIDLVVLDIMMPTMDGGHYVRARKTNTDLPLLMLTARGKHGKK